MSSKIFTKMILILYITLHSIILLVIGAIYYTITLYILKFRTKKTQIIAHCNNIVILII